MQEDHRDFAVPQRNTGLRVFLVTLVAFATIVILASATASWIGQYPPATLDRPGATPG